MKKVKRGSAPKAPQTRANKVTFLLNDDEQRAIQRYLERYKISNRSRWCRETIMTHIFRTLEEDYPTLFNENEMRR